MTRHDKPKTAVLKIRIEPELLRSFEARCEVVGRVKSEVLRRLIDRWLRETREIERLKS